MEKTVIRVEGMSCSHCVKAVTEAVSGLAGVSSVQVDLAAKTATVEYDPAKCAIADMRAKIEDIGFEVTD